MIFKTGAVYVCGGIMISLLILTWVLERRIRIHSNPVYLPMIIFSSLSLLALLFAQNRALSLEYLAFQVCLFIIFMVTAQVAAGTEEIVRTLRTVCIFGQVVALLGLLQYFGVHLIPLPEQYGDHPVSTLGNPNFVAHYLCMVIPVAAALFLHTDSRWERAWIGTVLLTSGVHLLITRSRAGWLVALVALALVAIAARRQVRIFSVLGRAILLAVLLISAAWILAGEIRLGSGERLTERFEYIATDSWQRAQSAVDLQDFSIAMRRIIWMDTVNLIRSSPFLGTGPGNFELHLPAHRSLTRHREWEVLMGTYPQVAYRAHNEYLELAAETGIAGLVTFLWMTGVLIWSGFGVAKRLAPQARLPAIGCLAAILGMLLHSIFSFNFQDPTAAAHFFLLSGLVIAVGRNPDNEKVVRLEVRYARPALVAVAVLAAFGGVCQAYSYLAGDFFYLQGVKMYLQHGHANRAKMKFERAIEWREHDFRYHRMLGQMELVKGRLLSAETAVSRSLALHPNNAPALKLFGETLLKKGDLGSAEESMKRLTQLRPLDVEGYRLLALARRSNGRHDQAVEAWRQALAFRPEDPSLIGSMGFEYAQAGDLDKAKAVLLRAASLKPQDGVVQGNLGGVYLGLGQYSDARDALDRALQLAPDNAPQWYANLAQAELADRNFEAAMKAIAFALALEPGNQKLIEMARAIRAKRAAHE